MSAPASFARAPLRDAAFIIPVRIDTPDRLRNLELVLAWIDRSFEGAQILVLEHDDAPRAAEAAQRHRVEHSFLRANGHFHKSHVFNLGVAHVDRPFALLYDCDVLVSPRAIVEAIEKLRRGEAEYVYPYNGVMLEARCDDRDPRAILEAPFLRDGARCAEGALDDLPPGVVYLNGTLAEPSTGGVLVCPRRTLLRHGGFNPNILSYGCEDTELETRVVKLGARVVRLGGYNCFHLRHRRGPDSRYNERHAANLAEWKRVEAMSPAEVAEYVASGFRLPADEVARAHAHDAPAAAPRPTRSLADTAFIVIVDGGAALPPALVTRLVDEIEAAYRGYEIRLIERDGYRYRTVSHRDYLVYEPIRDEPDDAVLRRVANEVERTLLCVCSVFLDARPERLEAALDEIRGGGPRARELATVATEAGTGSRAERVVELLRARLAGAARAFACDREALLAWLANAGTGMRWKRWDEILAAACDEIGRDGA